MNRFRCVLFFVALFAVLLSIPTFAQDVPTVQTPKLLLTLPEYCPTPDGFAVDADDHLIVACPNYADQTQPGCIIKIDKNGKVKKWFNVPTLKETGLACPMGLAFGPNGELYICDNQGWKGTKEGAFKGRIVECKVNGMGDEAKVETRIIAANMEHPNGIRYHKGRLYVTNSLMTKEKDESGLLVSGVYCFDPKEKRTVNVTNTKKDPNLLLSVLTYNPDCQYGLDGIAFDKEGRLYLGNFGDGTVLRVTLCNKCPKMPGKVLSSETWAKDLKNLRTTDGICFDDQGNLYIADFSENAVAVVKPDSRVYRIAQSPDSDGSNGELDQPGEPIIWNGKVILSCFDCVTGPDKVNTQHEAPFTLTTLELVGE